MAPPKEVLLEAVQHPDPAVRRVGFDLDHPYVENVWVGVIGPTSTLLLRRLPQLWREASPARIEVAELAASLGVGTRVEGWNNQLWRTFRRLAMFRLATPVEDGRVGVLVQLPPVTNRQLARLPEWTARTHERLLGQHLERLALGSGVTPPTSPAAETAQAITARLDRMQHSPAPSSLSGPSR
jgi:hypothetical protein